MLYLDSHNAESYLRETGKLLPAERVEITSLAGGVSNEVLYISFPDDASRDFVLKQARGRLRVAEPWFCSLERIWREVEMLRVCREVLSPDVLPAVGPQALNVPDVLFTDRENYCFAMTAAPRDHLVWKRELLAGRADPHVAAQCGRFLGLLHGRTWRQPDRFPQLADRELFDQLRLDPYYRFTASLYPETAAHFQRLIQEVAENLCCVVHADFSPKNLLLYRRPPRVSASGRVDDGGQALLLVDFETGHFGDGAFDLGFFLSHLLLKAIYRQANPQPYCELTRHFWSAYGAQMLAIVPAADYRALVARGIRHLAGCLWARVDGKSKVEYLTTETDRRQVRRLAHDIFVHGFQTWDDVLARFAEVLGQGGGQPA